MRGDREQADHARRPPAPGVALDQREHQRRQPDRQRGDAGEVDLARANASALSSRDSLRREQRHDDREDRDRHVQEEDRLPADVLHEQPAEHRADRERHRRHARPRADRAPALLRRERVGDDRQRRRHHEARSDSLDGAEGDQPRVALREADHEARRAEHDDAEEECQPAPEQVAEAPAGDEQHRERQRVGVDRPLERGCRRVQAALDRRQRDVHDRVVEHDHEQREAHRAERPPAAVLLGQRQAVGWSVRIRARGHRTLPLGRRWSVRR